MSELAAGGGTNQQIAAALIMGPGTVKGHLEHVYRKLGVSNRTELSASRSQVLGVRNRNRIGAGFCFVGWALQNPSFSVRVHALL